MFNIYCEMPSGARSRGYYRVDKEKAFEVLAQMIEQANGWRNFTADFVLSDETTEIQRGRIRNA